MARFTTLYSGSSGNCAIVEEDGRYIMIDIGKSSRLTTGALNSIGLSLQNLQGICITHEHTDHISGLSIFTKSVSCPVLSGPETLNYLTAFNMVNPATPLVPADETPMELGGFQVEAFATSHDAVGCCGYHITTPKGRRMAIATDLGTVTQNVAAALMRADLVALEANYDRQMLVTGPYPYHLKMRIASNKGHLENTDAAAQTAALITAGITKFAFCHLSKENNLPMVLNDTIDKTFAATGVKRSDAATLQISLRYEVSPFIDF